MEMLTVQGSYSLIAKDHAQERNKLGYLDEWESSVQKREGFTRNDDVK